MATSKKSSKKTSGKKAVLKNSTPRKTDPVVHFEMPAEDSKRMSKFYSAAFGWKTETMGKEMGYYVLATTAPEVDKIGIPKKRGIINGGFYTKTDEMPAQYPSVVISVDNIKKSMNKITKAGGKVLGEPMEIPGVGTYVSFYDTEGNRASLMEPTQEMKDKTR